MMTNQEFDAMEQELLTLSRAVPYPPTPDLAAGFWRRLEDQRSSSATQPALSYAGLAASVVVVVLAVLIAVVSPARDAAADLFDRINIFETTQPTEDIPTQIIGPTVSLSQAEMALGRRITLLNEPIGVTLETVYLQEYGTAKAAVLWYHMPDGRKFVYMVTNTRVGKGLPVDSDATAEPVADLGVEAYYLRGPRIFQFYGEDGLPIKESQRLTHNETLVWSQDSYVYRIEGEQLKLPEMITMAQSVLATAGQ